MFEKFNFDDAIYLYNPCVYDPYLPFEELDLLLTEDMFRATFRILNFDYTIDVGWLPEGDAEGGYKIVLVKDDNWDELVKCRKTSDYSLLESYMEEYMDYIKNINRDI